MTRVLITNDDSYDAEGLRQLVAKVSAWAEAVVVVPDRQKSGTGHAITLHHPLRLREFQPVGVGGRWYLVEGTPTDCVNLALHSVMASSPPDLVLSGINHGLNLGDDVTYSGTVGAVLEGHLFGIPSIALSQQLEGDHDFATTAAFASEMLRGLLELGVAEDLLLNVNFPSGELGPVVATRLGRRVYREVVVEKTDPRGDAYYWLAGTPDWEGSPGTDHEAIGSGRTSVTPLQVDLTDHDGLDSLRRLVRRLASDRLLQPR